MSTAIIVSTHGTTAENLIQTIEMILGKQNNVCGINFLSQENTEILIDKYNKHICQLDISHGILFFVDIWGGTPFNAANRIINNKENYEIITGVNIPMLIEVCMLRDEQPSILKLVKAAIEAGKSGIKYTKNNQKQDYLTQENTKIKNTINTCNNKKQHMSINLVRIDDRLIHGQVVTCWTKTANITRIIVVNDEIAIDEIRKTLLTQVAPPGITAHVISVSKAIRVYNNSKYAQDHVMLLFNNPTDVWRVIEQGIPITSVNIGGMAFTQGKTQIHNAVSINKKDVIAFKKINQHGVNLEIRKVISDSPINIMELIKKIENKIK